VPERTGGNKQRLVHAKLAAASTHGHAQSAARAKSRYAPLTALVEHIFGAVGPVRFTSS
jgi:hypothetical protein